MLQTIGRGMSPLASTGVFISTPTFSPASIPDLVAWWDGDSPMTKSIKRASQVNNRVPGGAAAVQNTPSRQPKVDMRTLNGEPVLDLDGDAMMNVSGLGIDPSSNDMTIILVAAADFPFNRAGVGFGTGALQFLNSPNNTWYLSDGGSGDNWSTQTFGQATDENAHIFAMRKDANSMQGYFDDATNEAFTVSSPTFSSSSNFYLGGNNTNTGIGGYVSLALVYSRKISDTEMSALFTYIEQKYQIAGELSEDAMISAAGQSNMVYQFTQSGGSGAANTITALERYYTGVVEFINGATGASALLEANSGDGINQWINADGSFGAAYTTWANSVSGKAVRAILWDQGEQDGEQIGNTSLAVVSQTDRDAYKNGLITLFTQMRSVVGNVPIVICPIGRRASNDSGFQAIREIQKEISRDMENVFIMAGKAHYGLSDIVHLNQAGREALGTQQGNTIAQLLGKTDTFKTLPSDIIGVSRSGATVTITIQPSENNDFTPTTAIEGFAFWQGAYPSQGSSPSSISWTTAPTRTNATTITGTLSSTPSGNEYLIYQLGTMNGVDHTKLVLDTGGVPLASSVWADTGSGFVEV